MSGWQASQWQNGRQDPELSAILSGPLSSQGCLHLTGSWIFSASLFLTAVPNNQPTMLALLPLNSEILHNFWRYVMVIGGVSVIIICLFTGWETESERVHAQVVRKRQTGRSLFLRLSVCSVVLDFLWVICFSFCFNMVLLK